MFAAKIHSCWGLKYHLLQMLGLFAQKPYHLHIICIRWCSLYPEIKILEGNLGIKVALWHTLLSILSWVGWGWGWGWICDNQLAMNLGPSTCQVYTWPCWKTGLPFPGELSWVENCQMSEHCRWWWVSGWWVGIVAHSWPATEAAGRALPSCPSFPMKWPHISWCLSSS